MGKLVAGINGPFVGKVGHTIGSSWRGIPYIKSLGRRTKPPTEGEKINRYIFGMTQEWLYPLTEFLRVGFKNYTPTNQGVNAAKSLLYKNALIKDGFNSTIDPTLVKVSHGQLPLPARIDVEMSEENKLIFTWDTDCERVNEFDQVMLLAYDIEEGEANMTTHGQFRKSGRDELSLTNLTNFVVYAAFLSRDRESQSESVYLGSFTKPKIKEEETDANNEKTAKKTEDKAKVSTKSDDLAAAKTDPSSAKSPEIEEVPKNQLSLFDSFEEVIENSSGTQEPEKHEDYSKPSSTQEAENSNTKPEIKQQLPNTKETNEEDLEEESREPVIQRFTFINPNVKVKEEASKISDIGQDEPDEQVIIKKERLTFITTKKHLDKIKKLGPF